MKQRIDRIESAEIVLNSREYLWLGQRSLWYINEANIGIAVAVTGCRLNMVDLISVRSSRVLSQSRLAGSCSCPPFQLESWLHSLLFLCWKLPFLRPATDSNVGARRVVEDASGTPRLRGVAFDLLPVCEVGNPIRGLAIRLR